MDTYKVVRLSANKTVTLTNLKGVGTGYEHLRL